MSSNKGTSKSTEETLFLMIKLGLTLVVIVLLVMHFSDTEIGCNRHNDNPAACISDSNCRPESTYYDDEGEFGVFCNDAVRTPNHDFNAAEDPNCYCPEGWREVLDEDSVNYGMCEKPGEGHITCDYVMDPEPPEKDIAENHCLKDGEKLQPGETWEGGNWCCSDEGEKIECAWEWGLISTCRNQGDSDCPGKECGTRGAECNWR